MKRELIHKLHATLEELVHKAAATGAEFWLAHDLQSLLGYTRWANFERVIRKAMMACERAGYAVDEHFLPVDKLEELPPKKSRSVNDYALTRYACYLVARNADSSKDRVVFSQCYFALLACGEEIIEGRLADQERVDARRKLGRSEKVLSGLIYEHVDDDQGFRRIHTKGDQALFGGVTTRQMKQWLHVPKGRALADFLPTITIKAKDFANEITNFGIKRDYLHTEAQITREYIKNNREVRKLLGRRKITPEDLPAAEDVKKTERRLLAKKQSLPKSPELIDSPRQQLIFDPVDRPVHRRNDLEAISSPTEIQLA